MSSIPTITLPVVQGDATIGEAIVRLEETGTSGLVVIVNHRPVVVTARSLHNTLVASGGDRNTPISRVTSRAFPERRSSFLAAPSRSLLASEQDAYVVTDFNLMSASVTTDPRRAVELNQPFKFSDGLESRIA